MGQVVPKRPPISNGRKPKQKRSDYHFTGPDGSLWDSKFEYQYYTACKDAGIPIERCTESDTFSFTLPIRGGICGACQSTDVGQRRTLTPDFRLVSEDSEHKVVYHYIETKGYLRAKERALLRAFYKAHPDTLLSVVLQRTYPVGAARTDGTKSSIVDWFKKFLPNVKVSIWNGVPTLPSPASGTNGGVVASSKRKSTRKKN